MVSEATRSNRERFVQRFDLGVFLVKLLLVIQRDSSGGGEHRYHAVFRDFVRHCVFVIKLCRPYRARTKGNMERIKYDLRCFYFARWQPSSSRRLLRCRTVKSSGRHPCYKVGCLRSTATSAALCSSRESVEQVHELLCRRIRTHSVAEGSCRRVQASSNTVANGKLGTAPSAWPACRRCSIQ